MLKKGLYITAENYNRYRNDPMLTIFLANTLSYPSYVTAETILRNNDVLSESTYGITSFSLKPPKTYINKIDTFRYNKIKNSLYSGYLTGYFLDKKVYYASKAKALFDYIYIRSSTIPGKLKGIDLVEELRLNLESFTKEDFEEFSGYRSLVPNTKFNRMIINIIKNAPALKFTKIN
jgi:hypothetical protein